METINLFRGISVAESQAKSIVEEIEKNGLIQSPNSSWKGFLWKDQKDKEKLFLKEDLNREDTGIASKRVFVPNGFYTEYLEGNDSICFADKTGAEYYARVHNQCKENTTPILIEARLEISCVAIDGRDFLYTAFSALRRVSKDQAVRLEKALISNFGIRIKKYIDKVFSHLQSDTNAICDLIVCDNEIKEFHYHNNYIIKGRFGTHFKCAFLAKVPIHSTQIVSVKILDGIYSIPKADYDLSIFLKK